MLLFHADGLCVGGYLGVDLFFVLSGFLITSLLVREHETYGRIDVRAFWVRRARRLVPALLLLMPAIAVYARFFARPEEVGTIRWDALATLGYVANWRAVLADRSYWDLFVQPSPLEHTWSLAIEEQFYLVWPLLVVVSLRVATRRGLLLLSAAAAAASAVAMALLFDEERTARAYFGTDTRLAAIALGAALALGDAAAAMGRSRLRVLAADLAGAIAALGIGVAWARIDGGDPFLYRGGFWLTEIAALALVVCAMLGPRSLVARALALAPLRWLGTVSYGAYLWHWPIHVVMTPASTHLAGPALWAARLAVTLAVSTLSYRLVERPIREGRWSLAHPLRAAALGLAAAALVVVAGTTPRPLPPPSPPPEPPPTPPGEPAPRVRVRIAVHGDSTANSLGWALRGVRDPEVSVLLEGDDGFNVLSHDPPAWPASEADVRLVSLGGAFLYGIRVKGRWTKSCHPAWDARFEESLDRWLVSANDVVATIRVATVPYPLGRYETEAYRREVDCINRSIRAVVARHPKVRMLELGAMICPGGKCARESGGAELRPDGVHYDLEGARSLARELLAELEEGRAY